MAGSTSLTFKIFGHDVSASKAFHDVGKSAAGVASGIGAAFAASKIVDFAKDSVNAFQDVGGETIKLQRYMGGSAEDASRLAAAFAMTGTDSDVAGRSLGILSKHLVANDKAAKGLGLSLRDSQGQLKPMSALLPSIADKFSKMANGPAKTALALQLFGRGGMAMMPFLNKGAAGIKKFGEESDKLGTTLSGKDLQAVKANTLAKRQFGEAVKGLQIAIGRELYPVLTAVTQFMMNNVIPVVRNVIQFMKDHKDIVSKVAAVLGTLGVAFLVISKVVQAFTAVQTALNVVMAMNPIGLVVIGILALIAVFVLAYNKVSWFRTGVDAAWGAIKTAIGTVTGWFVSYVWPAIRLYLTLMVAYYRLLWTAVVFVFNAIKTVIGAVWSWFASNVVPGLKVALGLVGAYFTTMQGVAKKVWDAVLVIITGFVDKVSGPFTTIRGIVSGLWDGLASGASAAFNAVKDAWNNTVGGRTLSIPGLPGTVFQGASVSIPRLATGGIALGPTLALIGEAGPEAIVPLSGANAHGFGGGGGDVHIHVNGIVSGSADQVARQLAQILRDGRRRGVVGAFA